MAAVDDAVGGDVQIVADGLDEAVLAVEVGVLQDAVAVVAGDELGDMPEFGVMLKMDADYDQIRYYGYGPNENYVDRREGARLGIFKTTTRENVSKYLVPQECGNRCDVRWLSLTASDGRGVQFVGAEPLSVSVWNCTQESLDKARHSNEVEPLADALTVNIDRTQTGVGGTDTWSLKARPSDQSRLLEKHYACRFTIIPCNGEAETIRNGRSLFRNQ